MPWDHKKVSPVDAVVISVNQEMMGVNDDNTELLALLQGAGSRVSADSIAYCNGLVDISSLARQGLDLGGFDTTSDMEVRR